MSTVEFEYSSNFLAQREFHLSKDGQVAGSILPGGEQHFLNSRGILPDVWEK